MEIQDIIQSDQDRLFIVDPECYIIFTGNSTDDDKPFIRIGNWIDMPIELIPLIENIVITDSIIGNPSREQFNIDIQILKSNRYIGSKRIVERYLDYQRVFGLDLTNASIVDIEKDLPELSKEENISEISQFIGVFYRDGNFKTVYNNKPIFDLKENDEKCISFNKLHNMLAEQSVNNDRYKGSGFVIVEHNPLFYHNTVFSSYLFPSKYIEAFSRLSINPGRIKEFIYPSINMINVTKILKWYDSISKNITIISDYTELIRLLKKLFSQAQIKRTNFTGFSINSNDGKAIKQYPNSYNIKVSYKRVAPSNESVDIAYIKGTGGINDVIKDSVDGIFVSYSVFEDTNLLFKSAGTPVVIVDDGNRNISRLNQNDTIVVTSGMQYDFKKHKTMETILSSVELAEEFIPDMNDLTSWADLILNLLNNSDESFEYNKSLFNIQSIVKLIIATTTDRKLSGKLKDLSQKLYRVLNKEVLYQDSSIMKIDLNFYDNSIFQTISDSTQKSTSLLFDEITDEIQNGRESQSFSVDSFFTKVITDRLRLLRLLSIYIKSDKFIEEHKDSVKKLRKAIEKRKDVSNIDSILMDEQYKNVMFKDKEYADTISAIDENSNVDYNDDVLTGKRNWRKTFAKLSILLLLLIGALSFVAIKGKDTFLKDTFLKHIFLDDSFFEDSFLSRIFSRQDNITKMPPKVIEDYRKKYNIRISNRDIFRYANKIAIRNGFNRIPFQSLRTGKNPDWIYPSNVFTLTDGEKVTVKDGDTLWGISEDKLVRMTIEFHKILDASKDLPVNEKSSALEEARQYAFTKSQIRMLNLLTKDKKGNETRNR